MDTRRSEWEEDKDFKSEQVRDKNLDNYNNIFTSWWLSNKDPKDYQILDLLGVDQKLSDDSKKSYEKSNTSKRETTKE